MCREAHSFESVFRLRACGEVFGFEEADLNARIVSICFKRHATQVALYPAILSSALKRQRKKREILP